MKRLSVILFLSLMYSGVFAQGANTYMPTNLYMFNTLMVNPAYAGVKESFSFSAMYSKWWMGWEGDNDMQVITGHTPLKNNKIAIGFQAENQRFGLRNYTNAYLIYNYRIEIGGGKLGMGLRAGGNYFLNNLSVADLPQQGDPAFTNDQPFIMPNFGAGFYYYSNRMYAGLSVPAFLFPKRGARGFETNFYDYNFTFVGGVLLRLSDQFKIKPSAYVQYVPSEPLESIDYHINTSFILFNDIIWLGGSYKSNHGLVGILEFQVTKQIRMGYAYEFPLGDLKTFSNGVHEFLLRYDFSYIVRAVDPGFFW
jgi:type IX secretion system PorP/SprF family membrane protein